MRSRLDIQMNTGSHAAIDDSHFSLITTEAAMLDRERLAVTEIVVIGLDSLGVVTAVALARAGVGHFLLIDYDRSSLSSTHGAPEVLHCAVEVVRDAILAINPVAHVEFVSKPLVWGNPATESALELEHWLIRHPRALVVATFVLEPIDSQLDELLTRLGMPAIYASSALHGNDHGRILRVIPGQTPCLQDLLDTQRDLPSSHRPSLLGLAFDIWRIGLLTARFALQVRAAGG